MCTGRLTKYWGKNGESGPRLDPLDLVLWGPGPGHLRTQHRGSGPGPQKMPWTWPGPDFRQSTTTGGPKRWNAQVCFSFSLFIYLTNDLLMIAIRQQRWTNITTTTLPTTALSISSSCCSSQMAILIHWDIQRVGSTQYSVAPASEEPLTQLLYYCNCNLYKQKAYNNMYNLIPIIWYD